MSAVAAAIEEVRAEAAAWFAANWDPALTLGEWWQRLGDAGWGYPTWPVGRFGRGLSNEAASGVAEERRRVGAFGAPAGIASMLAGPTLLAHGTADQLDRFLPGIVSGEHIWCQLFSEPSAGSDLASLRTRAERDGDRWVVNGQKVWTSGAHKASYGILIARTDPDAPKHRGISYFVIDMRQPGVEVRPLKEMTGRAVFNEVFFTDAVVPAENLIGDLHDGWRVALTTLANERNGLGANASGGGGKLDIPDHTDAHRHDQGHEADTARARQRGSETRSRQRQIRRDDRPAGGLIPRRLDLARHGAKRAGRRQRAAGWPLGKCAYKLVKTVVFHYSSRGMMSAFDRICTVSNREYWSNGEFRLTCWSGRQLQTDHGFQPTPGNLDAPPLDPARHGGNNRAAQDGATTAGARHDQYDQ